MAGGKIGFIGLGVMGAPMSQRLLDRGHALVVHDLDRDAVRRLTAAGAAEAASAREVADAAHTVFVSLPTPAIVREVALGDNGIARGRAVRTFVDLSTTGSVVEREVAAALAARGIEAVDAPVSGGAAGAQKGTLAVMAAGRAEAVAGVRPLLEIFGKVFIVGDRAGQGQLMKLINNLLSSTAFAITCEALVAGVKGGLDADAMLAVINAGSGRNGATEDKFPKWVLPRTFAFGFPIASVCKDIALAIEECQALGVPMWVGGASRQLWHYARAQGGAANDMTSLVTYIEGWAGAEVRGKAAEAAKP
ncbi:MAG TPA: NAD(P)-dependent oxidoreductase [Burkholderiales bacterium]|nr:NAD(P)-dependent oxidoreductase [Burkholderiales bacterium]